MGKQSILRTIVNRNVERLLVREFLMNNTKKSGFGGLDIRRVPEEQKSPFTPNAPVWSLAEKGKSSTICKAA